MNRELRLLAAIAATVILLAIAACGTEDERPARTDLTGTWEMETLNGYDPSTDITVILNSDGTHKWTESLGTIYCNFLGTYSYAASKIIFVDTAITGNSPACNSGTVLDVPLEYAYFKEGLYLTLTGTGGTTYAFIKQ